jgi:hypothetical protein
MSSRLFMCHETQRQTVKRFTRAPADPSTGGHTLLGICLFLFGAGDGTQGPCAR